MTLAVGGQVDALLAALAEHWGAETEDDERRQRLADLLQYVDASRDGIASYARRGAQASSPIEKVMDVVIGRRLKAKGTSSAPTASSTCASSRRTAPGTATGRRAAPAPHSSPPSLPDAETLDASSPN